PGLVHSIGTADFVAATAALVERVGACVEQLLQDAGLRRDQVDTVYFTGGGSGVPQLRARISAALPNARSVEGELYGSIGAGLAVEAARRYG
ncbi:MAG: Hsp70 family protein, partial [Thauera sp.]|nr:Hsp70 family protein [Thauera sp.]